MHQKLANASVNPAGKTSNVIVLVILITTARIVIAYASARIMPPAILPMVLVPVLPATRVRNVNINVMTAPLVWTVLNSVNVISTIPSLVSQPMANVFANRDGEVFAQILSIISKIFRTSFHFNVTGLGINIIFLYTYIHSCIHTYLY